jgi:putative ABC transport system permease protein
MSSAIDLLGLAWNGVRRRRLRAYLTILGIFIGIAAIVALISLGQGLQAAIIDSFSSFGPDLLIIQTKSPAFGPPGSMTATAFTDKDTRVIEGVRGVDVVAKRAIRSMIVEFKKKTAFEYGSYFPDDKGARELAMAVAKAFPAEGRVVEPRDTGKVNLGAAFAEDTNPFKRAVHAGDKLIINGKPFTVAGVFKKSGRPGGDAVVIFTEHDFNQLFNIKDTVDFYGVRVAKGADPEKVADDIARALRKSRNVKEGREDFTVQTPGQVLSTFNTVLGIVQAVLVGIAAISLMVGGIGVMNTMYTAVLERRREIGVMKAIGGRNGDIFMLFFFESGMLGMVGGVIGIIIGTGMAKMVEFVGTQVLGSALLKASLPLWLIGGALAFSFLVGSISGTLPAMQAARTNPVDALRD